jgi:hypothetical protein
MKKYNIIVIYPGMYRIDYDFTANLYIENASGYYRFVCEGGNTFYFPISLTIIKERENV